MGWIIGSSIALNVDNGALLVLGAYPKHGPKAAEIEAFVIQFAKKAAEREASLVSGNGSVIGNALLEGVQQACGSEALQYLCNIPTKQHGTVAEMTHAARSRYFYNVRQDLISKANIMIIISGEKHGKDGSMVHSDTVMSEYTLGIEHGRFAIPVATFGGCSEIVHTKIAQDIKKRMHPYSALPNGLFAKLADKETSTDEMIETVFDIADWIVEHKLAASSRRSSIASDGGAHPFHSRTPSGVSLRGSERPRSSNHQTNKTSP